MRPIIEGPPGPGDRSPPVRARISWFFGLALAGGVATALIAYALKALLPS